MKLRCLECGNMFYSPAYPFTDSSFCRKCQQKKNIGLLTVENLQSFTKQELITMIIKIFAGGKK